MASPKFKPNIQGLYNRIKNELSKATFFCDSSMFDSKTDNRIWDAILNSGCSLVIINPVRQEIDGWISHHQESQISRAILGNHPAILTEIDYPNKESFQLNSVYYVNLLVFRKRLFKAKQFEFQKSNGRPPGDQDNERIRKDIEKSFGPRGYLLANKGRKETKFSNLHADERLVFEALFYAIQFEKEVVILSKDEDIQEQFYKLQWLFNTHYRGLLFASIFHEYSPYFTIKRLPMANPSLKEAFIGDKNYLIEKYDGDLDELLPQRFLFIPVHCWILGAYATDMIFAAEDNLRSLFQMKAKTLGLNTDLFDGQNCHIWLAPLDVPDSIKNCAIIAEDRKLNLKHSKIQIPILDVNQALYTWEDFK